jgi:hypothetical protein
MYFELSTERLLLRPLDNIPVIYLMHNDYDFIL